MSECELFERGDLEGGEGEGWGGGRVGFVEGVELEREGAGFEVELVGG